MDQGLPLPSYSHPDDAGLDLCSTEEVSIKPGERALIPTGLAMAIPPGYAGFVQPRSGLAASKGLGVLNSPGLIDSGYRGEIKVIVINLDPFKDIGIARGERIAQLVVLAIPPVSICEVEDLPDSVRGQSGFGSTGSS